jgi:hypothetical protein
MNLFMDEKKIKESTKQILDKFAKSLEKIKDSDESGFYLERDYFERNEKKTEKKAEKSKDPDFKKRILDNAQDKNEDFIITEKGDWK